MKIENWIYEQNLLSFISVLSYLLKYKLGRDDMIAIKYGLCDSDIWLNYTISDVDIDFLSYENTIYIRIDLNKCNTELIEKISFLFNICQNYSLRDLSYDSIYNDL